jgi:hypothetical protein
MAEDADKRRAARQWFDAYLMWLTANRNNLLMAPDPEPGGDERGACGPQAEVILVPKL